MKKVQNKWNNNKKICSKKKFNDRVIKKSAREHLEEKETKVKWQIKVNKKEKRIKWQRRWKKGFVQHRIKGLRRDFFEKNLKDFVGR
jgi:fructosamine-3-kinase